MPNDDVHKPPPVADDIAPKSAPLGWLWKFNHGLDIVNQVYADCVDLSSVANASQQKSAAQTSILISSEPIML